MKLLFKQRFFSWFDSYDIYDEEGNTLYVVKGQLSWGHCLKIFDGSGNEIGMVQERIFTLLPKFEMYLGGRYVGCISKEFTFLKPKYNIDCNGWHVEGNFFEWDYEILSVTGMRIAEVHPSANSIATIIITYIIFPCSIPRFSSAFNSFICVSY